MKLIVDVEMLDAYMPNGFRYVLWSQLDSVIYELE